MGNHPARQKKVVEAEAQGPARDHPHFGKSPTSHTQAGAGQDPRLSFSSLLPVRIPCGLGAVPLGSVQVGWGDTALACTEVVNLNLWPGFVAVVKAKPITSLQD